MMTRYPFLKRGMDDYNKIQVRAVFAPIALKGWHGMVGTDG